MPFLRRDGRVTERRLSDLEATKMSVSIGPLFAAAPAASTNVFLGRPIFTGATAVALTTRETRIDDAGRVVGLWVLSDANITAGTLTARPSIAGVAQVHVPFAGCVLSTTLPQSASSFVEFADGLPFAAGALLGMNILTNAGYLPITANITGGLVVAFDP
jgi:hypothetical protein